MVEEEITSAVSGIGSKIWMLLAGLSIFAITQKGENSYTFEIGDNLLALCTIILIVIVFSKGLDAIYKILIEEWGNEQFNN